MVTFGGHRLLNAFTVRIQESRVIHDRLIPSAKTVGYRADQTAGGRVLAIEGQIQGDLDYVLRLEELRARVDDVARPLDLEDGSTTINAKLGSVDATWTVEEGVDRPSYSATFYETS